MVVSSRQTTKNLMENEGRPPVRHVPNQPKARNESYPKEGRGRKTSPGGVFIAILREGDARWERRFQKKSKVLKGNGYGNVFCSGARDPQRSKGQKRKDAWGRRDNPSEGS